MSHSCKGKIEDLKRFWRDLDVKKLVRQELPTFISVTVGTAIICFALVALTVPYKFAGCGITGLALITTYLWDISPVWVITIGNWLLLFWGWRALSSRFAFWTLYVSILTSFMVPIFEQFHYPTMQNTVLAAIFCGMVGGLGFGMLFRVGASSGGTDVVVMVAKKKWNVEIGAMSFYINIAILVLSIFVVDFEQLMLGVLVLYVETLMIDNVIRNFNKRIKVTVVSQANEEIKRYVLHDLSRSATVVPVYGAFSGEGKSMLIIVLSRRQVALLKQKIAQVDPRAFVVFSEASEVVGEGFHSW